MSNNNNTNNGIGFAGVLSIVFIVLKLCHLIDWSWIWVLSPIWISFILFILLMVIFVTIVKRS